MQRALARVGVAVIVAAGVGPCRAAAEPGPSGAVPAAEPTAPTPIYVVRAAGTDPGLLAAVETARARLQGQGVVLTVAAARPDETAAARARALVAGGLARGVFWFDERAPDEIRVFMLAADGSAWVRRVPVEPTAAEATREAVWLIVESSSLALATGEEVVAMEQAGAELVAGDPAGTPASDAAESEPVEREPAVREPLPPEPAPPRRPAIHLGLGYLGESFAPQVPWQSGVGIDGAVDLGRRFRVGLGYGLLLPWRGGDPPVTWRHRVELRGGVRRLVRAWVELYALVGGALDLVRWRATAGEAEGLRAMGLFTFEAGARLRLHRGLWLVVEPGAAVLLNRFDFVECAAGATRCDGMLRRVVLAPHGVRLRARAGLAVQF
jgi:hypothetical protein